MVLLESIPGVNSPMPSRFGVLLGIAGLFCVPCSVARADDSGTEAVLEDVRVEFDLPAVGAIVFRSDEILTRAAVGKRARDYEAAVTVKDKWHLGSITKSMTATLAAILVEEKKLTWETSIEAQLEKFKIHDDYKPITLQQLMLHRGGFPENTIGGPWYRLMWTTGTERNQRAKLMKGALVIPPEVEPGTKAHYANLNFIVAGAMLEEAADAPWSEMMRARLFDPLGMNSAGFGVCATKQKTDQPWGHTEDGRPVAPETMGADNPPVLGPAGTVHCSLNDLARYGSFHLRLGTTVKGKRLLPRASFRRLHGKDNQNDEWGFGWVKVDRPWAGGIALTHVGTNTMNYAVVWLAPERKLGLAVVTNQGGDKAFKALDTVVSKLISEHAKDL